MEGQLHCWNETGQMRWILVDHHLDQDHYHCMTGGASVTKKDKV